MTTLRIFTVDDEPLALRRLELSLSRLSDTEHVGSAQGCAEALEKMTALRPDVVLLDISMGDETGFDLLDMLSDDLMPIVIFVTAFDIYASRAFDVHAVDYVLKPVELERLSIAVDRAKDRIKAIANEERVRELREVVTTLRADMHSQPRERYERDFWIRRHGSGYIRIAADDIDSISSEDDYVKIRSTGREHLMRATVTGMHARLDPQQFIRVHRSVVVRVGAISEFRRGTLGRLEVHLRDRSVFPVGRVYAKALRHLIPFN